MNTINNILFDFQMQHELFARELYAQWELYVTKHIEPVADEVLIKYNIQDRVIEIKSLELDLGEIEEKDFYLNFPDLLREKLEEALIKCLHSTETDTSTQKLTVKEYAFEMLTYYLIHGTFPSTAYGKYKDIHLLFSEVLSNDADKLKRFLFTYGHYSSLQERLVYQLDDVELGKGVQLLQPESADFICSYVILVRKKQVVMHRSAVRQTDYRNTVWFIVYSYMLTNQGSYFNKKTFVTHILLKLSAKYNVDYEQLIASITSELETFIHAIPMPSDLFKILHELRAEWSQVKFKKSFTHGAKLYKILFASLKQEVNKGITVDGRTELIRALSHADSCRILLSQLTEKETFGLVFVLTPAESPFVFAVAESLDRQRETGALQGQAGGEFRIIKWQIIFGLLLQDQQAVFNRKYFVRNVFNSVSAHYNMDILVLYNYFFRDASTLDLIDKNLLLIIDELRKELTKGNTLTQVQSLSGGDAVSGILQKVNQDFPVTLLSSRQLQRLLSDSQFRRRLLDKTTDAERTAIIQKLFPADSQFITDYIQNLDLLKSQHELEGRTASNFTQVKWDFVLTVLYEISDKSFNAHYFVNQVLHCIASHYNTTFFDLLAYFVQEELNMCLPYRLHHILNELYREEYQHWKDIESAHTDSQVQGKINTALDRLSKTVQSGLVVQPQKFTENTHRIQQYFQPDAHRLSEKYHNQFYKLVKHEDFICYIESIILLLPRLRVFFEKELKTTLPDEHLLEYLMQLSAVYKTVSRTGLMQRFMQWIESRLTPGQQTVFNERIVEWTTGNKVLAAVIYKAKPASTQPEKQHTKWEYPVELKIDLINNPLYIRNAGLVLIAPYFPRLFSMLHLTEKGLWNETESQQRAIHLLQYIVFGKFDLDEAVYAEHELILNKLLTGYEFEMPVPLSVQFSKEEKNTAESLIKSCISQWSKLGNTSVEGFKEAFLIRDGKLEETPDFYLLTVEEKAYDMLIDTIPWSFRMVKYSWMKKPLQVKWR